MKTLLTYSGLSKEDKGAVIALGNFDGLHRGHQAVISEAKSIADGLGAPLGIGLFRPHPRKFFKPDTCLLYTSPSPRDRTRSRMPSSA